MATVQSTVDNRANLAASRRDRGTRIDGVASRAGFWIHTDFRRPADKRFGERARRRPDRRRLRRLVPRGPPQRA